MNKREALGKLKKYWMDNDGADYLNSLRQLRKDVSKTHRSSHQLDEEILAIQGVYEDFIEWKETAWAQRKKKSEK